MARDLGVSLDAIEAIKKLNCPQAKIIDCAKLNNRYFFCASGVGFDAHVAHQFSKVKKRGIAKYIWLAAKAYFFYTPKEYLLVVDGLEIKTSALFIAIANSSQFGGDFKIAPGAKVDDGELQCVMIKKFPHWQGAFLVFLGFTGNLKPGPYVQFIHFKNLTLECLTDRNRSAETLYHMDGEPLRTNAAIKVNIVPSSLKVVC